MKYYNKNKEDVLLEFKSKESGLGSYDVSKRLREYVHN